MNKRLLFLDTETTGNEEKDLLCQVAYSVDGKRHSALFKPPIPISIESMAVHHITEKMVADKPAFKFSMEYTEIHDALHDGKTVLVAHNAIFDIGMLKKEGIAPEEFICTLRVARHLDPDEKIPSYRLQYLRYLLDIEIEATAHDALGDVLVLEKLFDRLLKKMIDEVGSEEKAIEEMIKISNQPSIIKTFKFGKYNGKKVEEVGHNDRGYLEWLLGQKQNGEVADEDWIFTLKHYLGK